MSQADAIITLTMNFTGWTHIQRDVHIQADIENTPLEIKTDSPLGSNEIVSVWFQNATGKHVGGIELLFTTTPQYHLRNCINGWTEFSTGLPADTVKNWKITITRTSGIRFAIHCNTVEVLDLVMSNTACEKTDWNKYWSGNIKQMILYDEDTASDYYRGRGC